MKEKKPGVFSVTSSAFLHFHDDPEGLFADIRTGEGWERFPVGTKRQQTAVLSRVRALLKELQH